MPNAWPPLELISFITGSKLVGLRARRTTEYVWANFRAMQAPYGSMQVSESQLVKG